jgi:allantoicase
MQNDPNEDKKLSSLYINLADARVGTEVLYATDDFFAEKENLIKPGRGIFIPEKYTDRGKWMDGWESRRKRVPGHDFCVIKLGLRGKIRGVDIDTGHFLGNHPPHASIEGWSGEGAPNLESESTAGWTEILPKVDLKPGSQNLFEIASQGIFTFVRLHIYPDGGVARFRVYGEVVFDWTKVKPGELVDLAAVERGGKVLRCNDMFFSSKDNLIMPGRGVNMGDGWETKRRRTPGHDWVILELGHPGVVRKVELDTAHFKGNYPDRASLEGSSDGERWFPLMAEQKLKADHRHYFESELNAHEALTQVRLNIFPDGGVSRLRLVGEKK